MIGSVFPEATLDREAVRWEEHLDVLTPVERPRPDSIRYKREDYFAPLGYGGINGSKLRQLLYLIDGYWRAGGRAGILTGASVLSPQVSMAALVARHYELPCEIVLGATSPETSINHENVAIAARVGAEFRFNPVGFNPALQRAVADLHALPGYAAWYRLCYGITTPSEANDAAVAQFHRVGARQAENVPEGVRTLVMTAGSCNSCVSVLYGLALHAPKSLERVLLLGVGPTRLQWIEDRLAAIGRATGRDLTGYYRRLYHHHAALEADHQTDGSILLEHFDLHSTGYATYQDKMPWAADGIEFHPTYEGKAMRYLHSQPDLDWFPAAGPDVLFWIVGSQPTMRAMTNALLLDGI